MYRAVAWAAVDRDVPLDDERAVADLATRAAIDVDPARVVIDGVDVTQAIRTPTIDRAAALVARLPAVRAVLVTQSACARRLGRAIVMEGRDIGTTVFPDADVKVYLDADPAERARRRAHDPAHQGHGSTLAAVSTAIDERDAIDRARRTSPLTIAPMPCTSTRPICRLTMSSSASSRSCASASEKRDGSLPLESVGGSGPSFTRR